MSERVNHRRTSGLLSTIAFSPIPPPTHAYVFRTHAPPSSVRSIQRSPYAATLRHHYDPQTQTLYAAPTATPPLPPGFTTDNLPAWYQPDPQFCLPMVALPVIPEEVHVPSTAAELISIEAESPSGLFFRLPKGTNSHYYQSKYAGLEVVQRQKETYARFSTRNPDPSPPLPHGLYQDPPKPASRRSPSALRREDIQNPDVAHVYLRAHTPKKYVPLNLRDVREDYRGSSVHDRYFPVRIQTLLDAAPESPLILLLCSYATHIYYHASHTTSPFPTPFLPPNFHNIRPEPLTPALTARETPAG